MDFYDKPMVVNDLRAMSPWYCTTINKAEYYYNCSMGHSLAFREHYRRYYCHQKIGCEMGLTVKHSITEHQMVIVLGRFRAQLD